MGDKLKVSAKHYEFASKVAAGIPQTDAYMQTLATASTGRKTASVKASIMAARPEIQAIIKRAKKELEDEILKKNAKNLPAEFKTKALTIEQLDGFLYAVILGKIDTEEIIPVQTIHRNKDGKEIKRTWRVERVKRKPNVKEKQQAVDMLYKRFGSYAPNRLFAAVGSVNEEGDLENVERVVVLSNGERLSFLGQQ